MIRYDKKLNQEINKTIRNFNQKISRLEKQERDLLPSKITKKDLKGSVKNRNELTRKLKELQRFSKRGAEEIITTRGGVRLTRYDLSNLKRETTRLKRNVTRELKRLEIEQPKVFGKKQGFSFAEMGDDLYLNLKATREKLNKKINDLTTEQFTRFKKFIDRLDMDPEEKYGDFKRRYLDMLTKLGYYTGYDLEKLAIIENKIKNLGADKFIKLFNEDKSIQAILEYYPYVTGQLDKVDPDELREDVTQLYDNLYDNLNDILKDYA